MTVDASDALTCPACGAAVLDIDVELGLLEPALVLREMHRRLHAPGRAIELSRQFVLCRCR